MMTAEERVSVLHARMASLQRRREIQRITALSAANAVLCLCLIVLVFGFGGTHPGRTAEMYSGAMMLYENAGPYVMVALIAFMAGVVISVILLRGRKQEDPKADIETEQRM